ncbi:hypothetical protein D8674_036007 [Pyrus ussuriensis x Pyrus communis]|uniref:DUF4219 domain-containing protein n=1 Tax=Pyrus ussuriensis x Pyrus communis TaxID=2448454 RepID=A0A5N5GIK7_9ROSA|nr:hypothetical protein D8674_036007 [Pyrus ussuriensis x Pyrus communis]
MDRLSMVAKVVPTLLNCKNYDIWTARIKKYLAAENLWDIVEGTYEPPIREDGETDHEAWRKKNDKALCAIHNP